MSKFIRVKTPKRSIHKECGQSDCSKDAKVTAVMKTGRLVMDVRFCIECAVRCGAINGS